MEGNRTYEDLTAEMLEFFEEANFGLDI